ncbi:MAG TPA: peptidoglycan DD-metalloendopeptidase family protein [Steroidobacteraceae bacterium]|nr:peptidoglycan DD-metalloendopeptidase family protein [Steroidobacteraceae bacterium]
MSPTRSRSPARSCAILASLALYGAAVWGAAPQPQDSAQAKARLAAVRARIAALTSHLGEELQQRDALSARLRTAELAVTDERVRLDALRTAQAAAERHRAELRNEQSRREQELQAQRADLAAQVRTAYMMGSQDELKLLLNQSNPATLGRTLAYYGYFAQQRSAKIDAVASDVLKLQQLVAAIETETARLAGLQSDARREMAALEQARAERAGALAALAKQVASGNQKLVDLKREEQAVESLVADLSRVLQDFPTDPTQSFERMRGKLPWPVVGRVITRYQEPQANSAGIRWNGETIEAARGAKIRAPYFGRVVYADWLQGLGLLLIIGHSGGYMTLYGHAEVLYKSVGDRVAPGDVIAALSDSGGAAPQLYFEIRQGRKAVDPKIWLRSSP